MSDAAAATTSAERKPCRHCGTPLNLGFSHCPVCQRSQSRVRDLLGSSSNLIGIAGALIALAGVALTYLQLKAATQQSNSATASAVAASNTKEEVTRLASELELIRGTIQETETRMLATSHMANEAFLKIQAVEARVEAMSAQRQAAISEATEAVVAARTEYAADQAQLATVPATTTVEIPQVISEQHCFTKVFGMKVCTPVMKTKTEIVNQANPEFEKAKGKLDASSQALRAAEERLEQVLRGEAASPAANPG